MKGAKQNHPQTRRAWLFRSVAATKGHIFAFVPQLGHGQRLSKFEKERQPTLLQISAARSRDNTYIRSGMADLSFLMGYWGVF